MRPINFFVVTQTSDQFPSINDISFDRGLIYPYPHIYIFKADEDEDEYHVVKMRPLSERCATVRDSRLNNTGVGIVIYNPTKKAMNDKLLTLIASIIKTISDDLGVNKYQIVSDDMNMDNFIDVFGLDAKVAITPSSFTKRNLSVDQ